MKKVAWSYVLLFGLAGVLIAIDQWTKYWVRTTIPFGEVWSPWPWLTPYARLVHWNNTGAAFGMLQSFGGVFTILAIIVAAVIIYYFPRIPSADWTLRLALSLQLAGAVGNLIDRLTFGQVTDFISVGTFPVFNVADSCITVGVLILLVGVWFNDRKEKEKNHLAAAQDTAETPGDRPAPRGEQGG